MTCKALIIGLGRIGVGYDLEDDPADRIATLSRAFAEHPNFELVGGVDPSLKSRELFASYYNRPAFSSIAVAIEEVGPDLVAIAVPTEKHYSVFLEVLQSSAGIKAILCEKPLSYDLSEAEKMVRMADSLNISLYTNYMRRCDRAVAEVSRRIKSCQIVSPVRGVCWYAKGLFNNGSHFVNLLQYWLGDVVDFKIINKGKATNNYDIAPDIIFNFEKGEVYFFSLRQQNFVHYSLELYALNGRIRYESGLVQWQAAVSDKDNAGGGALNSHVEIIKSDNLHLQWFVADQIACDLMGRKTSICTGAQGLSTMEVLSQVKKECVEKST